MQYRTEIIIPEIKSKINPNSVITLMGSCFSDNIGKKLLLSKFDVLANPLGIIYNPISLVKIIEHYLIQHHAIAISEIWSYQGIFSHRDFHSIHNALDPQMYKNNLDAKINYSKEHFDRSDFLILTLGTAWVYRSKSDLSVVSNCHKRPSTEFNKELLSIKTVVESLHPLIQKLDKKVILTVSPVRHIKDGMVENSRSKSILLEACHQLRNLCDNCYYFPSYEIMIDDLRDYRFYEKDLIHPSDQAIDYIWEKFRETVFSEEAKTFTSENEKLYQARQHKPFLPESDSFQSFCKNQLINLSALKSKYPFVDYSEEAKYFKKLLIEA